MRRRFTNGKRKGARRIIFQMPGVNPDLPRFSTTLYIGEGEVGCWEKCDYMNSV
jgi:hypothetical protein